MYPVEIPDIALFRHRTDLQIRFNDIDILGHVNNTVYLSFYDTGKAHYFQAVRHGQLNWREVETVIANVDCSYLSPIYFGEDIEVLTRCLEIHDKSFRLQQIIRNKVSGEIKSLCETVMVSFDKATLKAVSLPELWRECFKKYESKDF